MTKNIRRVSLAVVTAIGISISAPSLGGTAKENFDWYCAQCHGVKGAGDGVNSSVKELPVGPMDFTVPKEIKKYSNAKIIKTLTHGGPINNLDTLMPPWGNRLGTKEIKELMLYVRSFCKGADCPK